MATCTNTTPIGNTPLELWQRYHHGTEDGQCNQYELIYLGRGHSVLPTEQHQFLEWNRNTNKARLCWSPDSSIKYFHVAEVK